MITFENWANERVLQRARHVIPQVSRCPLHRAISGAARPSLRLAACLRSAVMYEGLPPSLLRGGSAQVRDPPPAICGRLNPQSNPGLAELRRAGAGSDAGVELDAVVGCDLGLVAARRTSTYHRAPALAPGYLRSAGLCEPADPAQAASPVFGCVGRPSLRPRGLLWAVWTFAFGLHSPAMTSRALLTAGAALVERRGPRLEKISAEVGKKTRVYAGAILPSSLRPPTVTASSR